MRFDFSLSCSKASIATTIIIIIIIAYVVTIIVTTFIIISLPYSEPFCPCNDHFCCFTSGAKAMTLWFALCLFVFSFLVCHFLLLLLFLFFLACVSDNIVCDNLWVLIIILSVAAFEERVQWVSFIWRTMCKNETEHQRHFSQLSLKYDFFILLFPTFVKFSKSSTSITKR